MPELPEVETVRRSLAAVLRGRRMVEVEVRWPALRRPISEELFRPLLGRRIVRVERRAKYILIEFAGERWIVAHLGMTGSFRLEDRKAAFARHDHLAWTLDDGRSLRFNDPRRFGSIEVAGRDCATGGPSVLPRLGPEPLGRDFDGGTLFAATRGRSAAIKLFLLDQRRVAGIGNIYASEALHQSGVRPQRRAGSLTRADCRRLARAVKDVLRRAIRAGGTTLRDYRRLNGSTGRFRVKLRVYDRAGELCGGCGLARIRRSVLGGRSTFHCPVCQR